MSKCQVENLVNLWIVQMSENLGKLWIAKFFKFHNKLCIILTKIETPLKFISKGIFFLDISLHVCWDKRLSENTYSQAIIFFLHCVEYSSP